ncbi:hypothetical protein GCM10027190_12690 [Spirosoma areae]
MATHALPAMTSGPASTGIARIGPTAAPMDLRVSTGNPTTTAPALVATTIHALRTAPMTTVAGIPDPLVSTGTRTTAQNLTAITPIGILNPGLTRNNATADSAMQTRALAGSAMVKQPGVLVLRMTGTDPLIGLAKIRPDLPGDSLPGMMTVVPRAPARTVMATHATRAVAKSGPVSTATVPTATISVRRDRHGLTGSGRHAIRSGRADMLVAIRAGAGMIARNDHRVSRGTVDQADPKNPGSSVLVGSIGRPTNATTVDLAGRTNRVTAVANAGVGVKTNRLSHLAFRASSEKNPVIGGPAIIQKPQTTTWSRPVSGLRFVGIGLMSRAETVKAGAKSLPARHPMTVIMTADRMEPG